MNAKKLIGMISLLLIGAFIGFFVSGRMAKQRIKHMHQLAKEPHREAHRLFKVLDLDEAQREQIRPILQKHMPAHRQMRQQFHQRMDSLRNVMFTEVEPLLNEEQKEKLERMRKERPKHHRPRRPYRNKSTQ